MICNIIISSELIPYLDIVGYIISIFVLGYAFKILKSSLNGVADIPKFNSWSKMFSDGIKVLIVSIVYFIPAILIILISAIISSSPSFMGIFSGASEITPIDILNSLVVFAGPWFLIAILYLVIIIPILFIAIVSMADNDSKLNSAFKFNRLLNKISTRGRITFITWYLMTGFIAAIIFEIGVILINISSPITPIIGIAVVSLTITPYLYIFISRSIVLFYKNSKLLISRKYIGIIILIIIGFLVISFSAANLSNNDSNNIKSYNATTNTYSAYGVSFNYPSNWDIQTYNNEGHEITVINNNFNSNNDSFHDDSPQFQIQISPNPPFTSDQDAINSIQNLETPSGWQIISNKTITLDGNTAYETIYSINNSTQFTETMTNQQITLVKNGNTYFLDFQAPANDYYNELTNFNTILNTLKIQ